MLYAIRLALSNQRCLFLLMYFKDFFIHVYISLTSINLEIQIDNDVLVV